MWNLSALIQIDAVATVASRLSDRAVLLVGADGKARECSQREFAARFTA